MDYYTLADLKFQSTRPIRGATIPATTGATSSNHFNPRAPYGARHNPFNEVGSSLPISIHAPHTGRDCSRSPPRCSRRAYFNPRAPYGARRRGQGVVSVRRHFNPRAPYGARPLEGCVKIVPLLISIHAPHTGRDLALGQHEPRPLDFNPRAPYGARRSGAVWP